MATSKTKRLSEPLVDHDRRKLPKGVDGEAAGPSSSDKLLIGIETAQPLEDVGGDTTIMDEVTISNGSSANGTPKKRGAGQKRGRSWNREEEVLLMDAWNEVAGRGLKAKDVTDELERVFHETAMKKWGESRQSTIYALDRKGGSLLARAKGLIRQFADIVTFAKAHTTAKNFPYDLSTDELNKVQQEINIKRQANNQELFRSWHVRDALIYHYKHFHKQAGGGEMAIKSTQKRKSYPQDGRAQEQIDVERQKLELERERFKEGQRATTLDSLHKLLSTLDADDESAPIIRQEILKVSTMM